MSKQGSMSKQGQYSVFIGNRGWAYGFTSLAASRTFVAGHVGYRYDIHKGAKLVESGKVHPPTTGTGGRVWLVRNPSRRPMRGAFAGAARKWKTKTSSFVAGKRSKSRETHRHFREGYDAAEQKRAGNPAAVGYVQPKPGKATGRRIAVYQKADGRLVAGGELYDNLRDLLDHIDNRWQYVAKNPAVYSVYSDDGLLKEGFKTLDDARTFAKRMAIDQNTYVYRNEDRLTTYKMKFPKSRNPLPVGKMVTVKAKRLPGGRIELRGIR